MTRVPKLGVAPPLLSLALTASCSGSPAAQAPRADTKAELEGRDGASASFENAPWGTFRSKRFELTLGLPSGAAWRIDDHRTAWLTAEHPGSKSTLWVRSWTEEANATRARCYARAREWLPMLPEVDASSLIDDRVRTLFAGVDTRVAVGVVPAAAGVVGTAGFVTAAGAAARRCFVVAFRTRAEGAGAEDAVAARLVLVSERLLPSVQLDQSFAPSRDAAMPSLRAAPPAGR